MEGKLNSDLFILDQSLISNREDARSGLRIDMAALMEPTVFTNEWKCGATPKAKTTTGRTVDNVIACRVPSKKRNVGRSIPSRQWEWHYFEKRDGAEQDCNALMKRHFKRDISGGDDCAPIRMGDRIAEPTICKRDVLEVVPAASSNFTLPALAEAVRGYNIIKPEAGKQSYARISAGMNNELFFNQADKSGLMTLGAQHGVRI
jgi:hypothetical protein